MSKRKSKPAVRPRQVGEFLVTESIAPRRKRSKQLPKLDQGQLFADGSDIGPVLKAEPPAEESPARSAAPSEHRTADAAGGAVPLFQSNGHCCDKEKEGEGWSETEKPIRSPEDLGVVVGREFRVRPCRCRKWFCAHCGPRMGWQLRVRLEMRLRTFTSVYGLTLTVDGSLFAGPDKAWQYVMDERLLSRLVRDLNRREHLHTPAYFWVVEFQEKTEQPHWHMLLDATRIPYGDLVEIWSRFRPASATPLENKVTADNYRWQAPAFGSLQFSVSPNREKAAYYATKYLTKYPRNGYPDWALDRCGRMPRFGHSHRFFPRTSDHSPMCFCAECRGDVEPPPKPRPAKKKKAEIQTRKPISGTTIRERLEACGNSCSVVSVQRVGLPDGTIVDGRGRFEGQLPISFREACEYLGLVPETTWQIELSNSDAAELEEFAKQAHSREAA